MESKRRVWQWVAATILTFAVPLSAHAVVVQTQLKGSDAIWLAGRIDLVIPPASDPWPGGLLRHGSPTPEEIQETVPPEFPVLPGDIVRVLDPADGGMSFF